MSLTQAILATQDPEPGQLYARLVPAGDFVMIEYLVRAPADHTLGDFPRRPDNHVRFFVSGPPSVVYPPTWWERLLGITWDAKIDRAVDRAIAYCAKTNAQAAATQSIVASRAGRAA